VQCFDYNHIIGELDIEIFKKEILFKSTKGRGLKNVYLNGLTELTSSAAKELTRLKTNTHLELRNVQYLDDVSLEVLMNFPCSIVLGVTSFSITQCEILSRHKGALELSSITKISCDQASVLSEYKGNVLELSSLISIDAESAFELSKFKGEYLSLGIKSINSQIIEALSSFNGKLFLDSLIYFNDDCAEFLSSMKSSFISMCSLKEFSDSLADELSKNNIHIKISSETLFSKYAEDKMGPLLSFKAS
jgi:hypothetical protein